MDNKNKFNTVKIATCNDAHKAEAVNQLFERSLLFNRSDDICGIVISKNDEKQFIPISAIPDNVNIEKREGIVTLVENPVVDSITTKADHNGIDWKSQRKIAETSAERTIILLCTKNIENSTNTGVIGGEILEVGEGIYGHYQVSLTPAGSGLLKGATTFEQKAALVRAKYNGTYYYGIKFKSTIPASIYFAGWDHFPDGADAPLYTSYTDADLSEIIELSDTSSGGMTEAEKAEISAMNTQINTNKNDIAALQTSVAGKAAASHTHDDRYYTETEVDTKLSGKSDMGHTHTKSQITDFPTSLPANGGTADTATTAAAILDYNKGTPIKVRWGGNGINSAEWYPAFSADGSALEPINRANIHAGTADYARNMYYQSLDLSSLDKTKFYPLVGANWLNFVEVAICSESVVGSAEYNQNRIHFDISTMGWSDLRYTLNIREYACYENNEITIGCIGRGIHNGAWAIWLRGGIHYTCFSRDADLSLKTSDYTYGDETYTVGTNYYGGSNSNVEVIFTPQSTITEGAYSTRPITATRIKADYRMVIPIGAPSSLEDGCIWIQ